MSSRETVLPCPSPLALQCPWRIYLYLLRLAAWDEGDIQWVCCIKSNPLLEDLVLGLSIGGEFMDRVLNNDPMSLLVLICLI